MNEFEDMDPRLTEAAKDLTKRIFRWSGKNMTARVVREIEEEVRHHRVHWTLRGVDFPKMVVIAVASIGRIFMFRKEMELAGVQGAIVKIIKEHPEVDKQELASEVMRAWPDYAKWISPDKKKLIV